MNNFMMLPAAVYRSDTKDSSDEVAQNSAPTKLHHQKNVDSIYIYGLKTEC